MSAHTPSLAVITLASGRREHLRHQHAGLIRSILQANHYIVVALDDPYLLHWMPERAPLPDFVEIGSETEGLPLAAARNRGAQRAIEAGAQLLVFLDVDCIPSPALLDRYSRAIADHPDAILSGAVGYLPEDARADDPESFAEMAHFHSFRPRLEDCAGDAAVSVERADPLLFWSLSFAVSAATWIRIGGFDERYVGYGGEDTDFGQTATALGVDLLWVAGAEAFHQYHPTEDPPVQHIDDIVRNGSLFADRWGFWPMTGWLDSFERRGLVSRDPSTGRWTRTAVPA